MKNKTGKVLATSASVMVSMALTLGLAPASQAAPLAPAVTTSVSSVATTKALVATPATLTVKTAAQSDPWAGQTLTYINQYRAQRGLAPLAWNQQIADVSQGWANHLGEATKSSSFDWANIHRTDAGGTLIPRGASWYREVVVFSFSPKQSVDWWMNSPAHRDAIMSPKATHIGIGHVNPASGPYTGWNQMVANLGSYATAPGGSSINPAGGTTTPSTDTVVGTAKATYNVNFRAGATTGSGIIDVVRQGATVNLLGASANGWTKVSYNGKTGYVSTPYLAVDAVAPAPVVDTVVGTAKATYNVNFRAGASTGTGILMVVPQGGVVNLLGASVNGWTKVSYAGKTGYISTSYLADNVATAQATYNVNFRAGASTGTGILMVVPQGATVTVVTASANGWTQVSYAGKTGYISSNYLTQ